MSRRLGILLSGRGSNFEAIARAKDEGQLHADIALVISNRPEAPGLARARERGLATACVPSKGRDRALVDADNIALLRKHGVDWVCLAGYLRLLTPAFIQAYPNRILNIHPSLLPAFPGLHAQRQALEHGAKVAGCTVHLVNEQLDAGPILLQAAVPVLDDDTEETLSARILAEEHRLYPRAIGWMLDGGWQIDGRRVVQTRPASPGAAPDV